MIPAGGYILNLPINPVPQERPRTYTTTRFGSTSSRTINPAKSREFRNTFALALLACRPRPTPPGLTGPLAVTIRCFRHTASNGQVGDIDNLAKSILDAGNQLLWVDDRQVRRLHIDVTDSGPDVTGHIWLRVAPLAPSAPCGHPEHAETPDARYGRALGRLRSLITGLTPDRRASLDQTGQAVRELLDLTDVDVRDPLVARAVLRTLDLLVVSATSRPELWHYLADIAAGFALNVELDKETP